MENNANLMVEGVQSKSNPIHRTRLFWVLTRAICCAILLFSALIKLLEPLGTFLGFPFFGIGVIELWIAIIGIVLNGRLAWVLFVVTFSVFSLVSFVSWTQSISCNCFGAETPPLFALMVDVIVLGMLGFSRPPQFGTADFQQVRTKFVFSLLMFGFTAPLVAGIMRSSTNSVFGRPVLNEKSSIGITIDELFSWHSSEMMKERFTGRVFFLHEGCDRCHLLANQASEKTSSDEVFVVWAHPGEVYTICAGLVTPNVARNIGEHVVWSSDAPTWTGPVCLNFVEGICVRWESWM